MTPNLTDEPAPALKANPGPTPGTRSDYRRGCRCGSCKQANATYLRRRRNERKALLTADDPRHGQRATYLNWMCRCDPCSEAQKAYCRAHYQRRKVRDAVNYLIRSGVHK